MSQPLLSIMVPLTPDRWDDYYKLRDEIICQIFNLGVEDKVQFTYNLDNKEMTLGEKRERMYEDALGLYTLQVDSDDMIAANGLRLILGAIKKEPDCITYEENCSMNGQYYKSNHSLFYSDWDGNGSSLLSDGFHFHRTPFYKDVIRTDIARSVPFEWIRYGEDHAWSRALKPHLRNEVHIDEEIYFYIHNSKPEDHNTRYGYDK